MIEIQQAIDALNKCDCSAPYCRMCKQLRNNLGESKVKQCGTCRDFKTFAEFYPEKDRKWDLSNRCRACASIRNDERLKKEKSNRRKENESQRKLSPLALLECSDRCIAAGADDDQVELAIRRLFCICNRGRGGQCNDCLNIKEKIAEANFRWCNACETVLPQSDFGSNASHKDGFATRCKTCDARGSAEYRERNPEKVKESRRQSHNNNKPERNARQRARYRKNKTQILEKMRADHKANPEKRRERDRKKRQDNPDWAKERDVLDYERNGEKKKAQKREKYANDPDHREAVLARNREYQDENREALNAKRNTRQKKRYAENQELRLKNCLAAIQMKNHFFRYHKVS